MESTPSSLPFGFQSIPSLMVRGAINDTSLAHLESCLKQRNPGPDSVGSVFLLPQTIEKLKNASWEEYHHPAVQEPAKAFKTNIDGYAGVITLDELALVDNDAIITLLDGHITESNPAGCGYVEGVVKGKRDKWVVFHTTILLGPDRNDPKKTVVWTFFPGDPIMPSRIKSENNQGRQITISKAREMGLQYVKLTD